MGYGSGGLQLLGNLIQNLPPTGGSILELGRQDIEASVTRDEILRVLQIIYRDESQARGALKERFSGEPRWPASELFKGTSYRYRCLDLYPGEFTIVADLNSFSVPLEDYSTFDLITNFGTTEHVTDQVNAFRVMHNYAKAGASFVHSVPFTGYLNHGLYNYHPLFFVFLAAANEYEIKVMGLSPPWLPYTIPNIEGVLGSQYWAGTKFECGDITSILLKINDRPFRLFTDYDQSVLERMTLPYPWNEMLRNRHDLRVREALP
jgi:SAM-dependent methyltransferase